VTRAVVLSLALAFTIGCHRFDPKQAAQLEASAVPVGAAAPDAAVTRPSGERITLAQAMAGQTQTIVVFYRGFF